MCKKPACSIFNNLFFIQIMYCVMISNMCPKPNWTHKMKQLYCDIIATCNIWNYFEIASKRMIPSMVHVQCITFSVVTCCGIHVMYKLRTNSTAYNHTVHGVLKLYRTKLLVYMSIFYVMSESYNFFLFYLAGFFFNTVNFFMGLTNCPFTGNGTR